MNTKLENIIKGNKILLEKLDELNVFLQEYTFNESKQNEKFLKLPQTESGKLYLDNINKEIEKFKKLISFEIDKLNRENYTTFIKKLINNYAKVEDNYFTLLSESKNSDICAVTLFKIQCKVNYLQQNLEIVNVSLNNLKRLNLEEKTF